MFKKIAKNLFKSIFLAILVIISLIIGLLVYINLPVTAKTDGNVKLGVTFSSRYASDINLNWKETYTAMLDDLQVKKIRIPVYWDLVEPKQGEYDFADLDWQLEQASRRGAEIILVVGQKVPRWPECFIPNWAPSDGEQREAELLKFIDVAVKRYKDNPALKYWQVENEPFLPFGSCPTPTIPAEHLGAEVGLVKNLDPGHKVIVTDSGELSLWYKAASYGDIFGTTMYRTIWKKGIGYYDYPIGPRFFQTKHLLVDAVDKNQEAFVIELQAEPWINGWTTSGSLEEQFKSMNPDKLKSNVEFAKQVGFPQIYLWGVEWWYWLKVQKDHPELWDTAKTLFQENGVVK